MTLTIPTQFIQGDSYHQEYTLVDYLPSDGWVLHLKIQGPFNEDITLTNVDDVHVLDITPAYSLQLLPGIYKFTFYVVKSTTDRQVIQSSQVSVLPDPLSDSVDTDFRTFNQKMVDALEALLMRRASSFQLDMISSTIDNKEWEKMTPDKITALLNQYKNKVRIEQGRIAKRVLYNFGIGFHLGDM